MRQFSLYNCGFKNFISFKQLPIGKMLRYDNNWESGKSKHFADR